MRVNELAKELGKSNKEVLDILQKQNQDVKTGGGSRQQRSGRPERFPGRGSEEEDCRCLPSSEFSAEASQNKSPAGTRNSSRESPGRSQIFCFRNRNS